MSDLTANGLAVLRGDLVLPRVGAWTADLIVDSESAPATSSAVAIESPAGLRLVGYAERAQVIAGRVEMRVRGGAGGLARELAPVAYRPLGGVRVRTVLEDLARESGESISTRIEPSLLAEILPAWTRERGTTERAIRTLARALGCSWRFDSDGGALLVRETWPAVDPDGVTVLREVATSDAVELGVDVPLPDLVPGVTWQGRRVSAVEAFVVGNGVHRVRLLFETERAAIDRDAFAIKVGTPRWVETDDRAFAVTYLARVVAQSTDLATIDVELEPDVDPARRTMPGLVRVPLFAAVPGAVIELRLDGSLQQFCLVTFINGDRAKPVVSGWLGSPNGNAGKRAKRAFLRGEEIRLGESSAHKVARDGDPVGASTSFASWIASVSAATGVAAPTGAIGAISDGSPYVKTD